MSKKSDDALDWIGAGIAVGIAFVLAAAMAVVAYGAIALGADWETSIITLIILIILVYVVFFIIDAISKKTGKKYSMGFFGTIGFTVGLIVITLLLSYWNIATSLTVP